MTTFAECETSFQLPLGPWAMDDFEWRHKCARPRRTLNRRLPHRKAELQSQKDLFNALAKQWVKETWYISSPIRRVSHPAYLKIIALGRQALPFIFAELQTDPDNWFPALEAITREESVAPNATTRRELLNAWLAWGKQHGYIA